MITATKEFKWEMAHMLTGHKGLCQNIHGHSYKMQVTVSRISRTIQSGSSEGMVLDFSDLKSIVEDTLINRLDHAFMMNGSATGLERELLHMLHGKVKIYVVDYRPTAENMARDFYEVISKQLEDLDKTITLESVKIWETATAYAEYRR